MDEDFLEEVLEGAVEGAMIAGAIGLIGSLLDD